LLSLVDAALRGAVVVLALLLAAMLGRELRHSLLARAGIALSLGLVVQTVSSTPGAAHDLWLVPRFHSQKVLDVCVSCEHVADFPTGGHGALLSPPPPQLGGLVGELLNDPPGFDRSSTVEVDRRITAFFTRHLLPL